EAAGRQPVPGEHHRRALRERLTASPWATTEFGPALAALIRPRHALAAVCVRLRAGLLHHQRKLPEERRGTGRAGDAEPCATGADLARRTGERRVGERGANECSARERSSCGSS